MPRTTVLIPAHNEAADVVQTLESVQAASFPGMNVLVVADNCTDATAELARGCGAQVVERRDTKQIGKGFALAFGIEQLQTNPPEIVIALDADCTVERDTLARLAYAAHAQQRAIQGTYLLETAPNASPKVVISNFAFLIKNQVRPLGLARWNAPCLLTGSGMAFPWRVLQFVAPTGHLSEDMWWSVELTCAGYAPQFCSDAFIWGKAPARDAALKTQRARWEHGHLSTMTAGIPKLLRAALAQRRAEPQWLMMELSIPPLMLFAFCLACVWIVCLAAALFLHRATSLMIPSLNLMVLGSGFFAAWWKFGRAHVSAQALFAAPLYMFWKIPLYVGALVRRRTVWTRTEREPSAQRKT